MQGSLLIMCIIWTYRQRRLGIDEFGNPLDGAGDDVSAYHPSRRALVGDDVVAYVYVDDDDAAGVDEEDVEEVPGLVTGEEEDPGKMSMALTAALESAAESDVREAGVEIVGEETPLLGKAAGGEGEVRKSVWGRWFGT